MILPSMEFYYNSRSEEIDVILPGSTRGTDSEFIQTLYQAGKKEGMSVVTFNYPFHERLEKKGFGEKVDEEVRALESVLEYCRADGYKKIRLLGKSLGGVVSGEFLSRLSQSEQKKFELVVLGYDLGWINIMNFREKIVIIQGSEDPFGGVDLVKKDLENATSTEIEYYEIKGADHGYRDPQNGAPIYLKQVVELLF